MRRELARPSIFRRMSEHHDGRFRLRVLGPPDLRAPDGRRVGSVLSQPKRLGLLTYLALDPGPVSRESVLATFWPDADEARARNALSQALFHLRRALGEDVVQSVEGDRLWVSPDRLQCDVTDLLAGGASVSGDAGELLEGWHADEAALREWLEAQRARVRTRDAQTPTPGPAEVAQTPTPGLAEVLPTSHRHTLPLRWVAAAAVLRSCRSARRPSASWQDRRARISPCSCRG